MIARNPKSGEGEAGLVQICRLCVAVGAMGPANERVIAKIQALDEAAMVELMKTIEGVSVHYGLGRTTNFFTQGRDRISLMVKLTPPGYGYASQGPRGRPQGHPGSLVGGKLGSQVLIYFQPAIVGHSR